MHTMTPRSFIRDVLQLGKPRIVLLLAITCAAGYAVATKGNLDLFVFSEFMLTVLGLSISAFGANTVNMWWDRDIDKLMHRTKNRPLPAGRWQPKWVLLLGLFWGALAVALLYTLVNPMSAYMALAGYLFYIVIYTMLLKRRTVQNIVIGGAAGAFPPLVGWAAVQSHVLDPVAWMMFAIIFLWTPPHFWALALIANADYTRASIPMLPVVRGETETRYQILFYMALLLPFSISLGFFAPFGLIYVTAAAALNGWWIYTAVRLINTPNNKGEPILRAQKVFQVSLFYLAFLFLAMVVDTFI